ncbi:MAG: lysophospholipid acyltransferase family protein [Anaerolineales bacterium]
MGEEQTTDPRERRRYYDYYTPTRAVAMFIIRLFSPVIYDLDVSGANNCPMEGGVILAANHVNILDVFPLQLAVPRPIFFMAKEELHRNRALDPLLRRLGSFPVKRGRYDDWALDYARQLLDKERLLGMFPEGTRTHGHGLAPGKTGAARLSIQTGCPLLPAGISGIEQGLGIGKNKMRITIRIGSTLRARQGEGPVELTDRLMYNIASLLPKDLRGAYTSAPTWLPELQRILDSAA